MITIIGLDKDGVYLEDIRVEVPYRVAVSIPANLMSSRQLGDAINQRRVFQLQGALPPGAVFRGLGAVPRGTAAAPPRRQPAPDPELQTLKAENTRLKQQLAEQQDLNKGLQTTLTVMSDQLTAIQGVLESLKSQGIQVAAVPGGTVVQAPGAKDDDAPMFIPSVKREDVKTKITVQGTESGSDLDASKNALKALRNKRKKS